MAKTICWAATFAIVTPVFMGGARQEEALIRVSSLRGALRFWWRFLAWADPAATTGGVGERLARMRRLETLLFGHAGSRRSSRQAALSIRLEPRSKLTTFEAGTILPGIRNQDSKVRNQVRRPGLVYLGYGLMEPADSKAKDGKPARTAGKLTRPCILPDQGFTVQFRLTPPGDLGAKESLYTEDDFNLAVTLFNRALRLFGLVGGLGSRARRGWGSIVLYTLTGDNVKFDRPATVDDYVAAIRGLLPPSHAAEAGLPPFTALCRDSRIDVLIPEAEEALSVLDQLGRGMQRYRSWGKDGKVNGERSEKNFQRDHDWFRKNKEFIDKDFVPERTIFGLPHNYDKNFGITSYADRSDRRASPLLLHVHRLADDWAIGVALLLPARFLPGEEKGWGKVAVKKYTRTPTFHRYRADWGVLRRLLDGFPERRTPYFPNKIKVTP